MHETVGQQAPHTADVSHPAPHGEESWPLAGVARADFELTLANEAVEDATERLEQEVGRLVRGGVSVEIISNLYWDYEEISPTFLAQALGFTVNHLVKVIHPTVVFRRCDGCGCSVAVDVHSRAAAQELRRQSGRGRRAVLCGPCRANDSARKERRSTEWQRERERRETRVDEMRTMPYKDYLRSSEWQETRKGALRRAGYRCQLCNASGTTLDVHHRTYERLGCEDNRDLIVLCRDCHSTFHGRLHP